MENTHDPPPSCICGPHRFDATCPLHGRDAPEETSRLKPEQGDMLDGVSPGRLAPTRLLTAENNPATQMARLREFLRTRGKLGAIDNESERTLGFRRVESRRRELVKKGLVVDSGARRATASGKLAIVWILTEFANANEVNMKYEDAFPAAGRATPRPHFHKDELKHAVLLTITAYKHREVSSNDGLVMKLMLSVAEDSRYFIVDDFPNGRAFKHELGKDLDEWIGKKFILYVDPTVEWKGATGALRVRFTANLPPTVPLPDQIAALVEKE